MALETVRIISSVLQKNLLFSLFFNLIDSHFKETQYSVSTKTVKLWQFFMILLSIPLTVAIVPRYLQSCNIQDEDTSLQIFFKMSQILWTLFHICGLVICFVWYIQRINKVCFHFFLLTRYICFGNRNSLN